MVKARTVKGITIGLLLFALVATAMLFPVSYAKWQGGTNSLNATVQVEKPSSSIEPPDIPAGYEKEGALLVSMDGTIVIVLEQEHNGTTYFNTFERLNWEVETTIRFCLFVDKKPVNYQNDRDDIKGNKLTVNVYGTGADAYAVYTLSPGKYNLYVFCDSGKIDAEPIGMDKK